MRQRLARRSQSGRAFADTMRASGAERRRQAEERERLLERERAAHAEAERAHRRTEAILESINYGFFALDRERRFVYVNGNAETAGVKRADRVGWKGGW